MTEQDISFERSKIYEKLDYLPEPADYKGTLPWTVQQQIAQTNGIHYTDRVGKLADYPVYEMPVQTVEKGIMLDIGCGWGRWLVAGANRNYIPVGIDLRLEFCQTALETLKNNNKNGYAVVADLRHLPFQEGIFDLVWTYSVIQHTHYQRMISCLKAINQLLTPNG
ncbi:MAG: class I SAM-dependent methyltransferase, partial [Verrucomicrobia bacterium]|nr:class I SAM-dependent methyltransferase [Cytophagales bacterium]